jgi:hypothetical protein
MEIEIKEQPITDYKFIRTALVIPPMVEATLFSGDRLSCCTLLYVAYYDYKPVGVLTFAPQGEQGNGQPTFVGVYISNKYRNNGIAKNILIFSIKKNINLLKNTNSDNNYNSIRIDCLTTSMFKAANSINLLFQNNENIKPLTIINLCNPLYEIFFI